MEYNALMREKLRMEHLLTQGGWGPAVPASSLKPGAQGTQVVALRNRLMSMGYLKRSNVMTYDATLQEAVRSFQKDHGLNEDGVAGSGTMAEINKSVETRLQSVIVAMERERWLNKERGARHVLVNIPAFTEKKEVLKKQLFAELEASGALEIPIRPPKGEPLHDRKLRR